MFNGLIYFSIIFTSICILIYNIFVRESDALLHKDQDMITFNNVLTENEFNAVSDIVDKYRCKQEHTSKCSTYPLSVPHSTKVKDTIIYAVQNELEISMGKLIEQDKFPAEYRKYHTSSSGMDWHKDKAIYDTLYYECVFTLSNTSDSVFLYIDQYGNKQTIVTQPNMLICLTPGTVLHSVSQLTYGEREIIKFTVPFEGCGNNKNQEYRNELIKLNVVSSNHI